MAVGKVTRAVRVNAPIGRRVSIVVRPGVVASRHRPSRVKVDRADTAPVASDRRDIVRAVTDRLMCGPRMNWARLSRNMLPAGTVMKPVPEKARHIRRAVARPVGGRILPRDVGHSGRLRVRAKPAQAQVPAGPVAARNEQLVQRVKGLNGPFARSGSAAGSLRHAADPKPRTG